MRRVVAIVVLSLASSVSVVAADSNSNQYFVALRIPQVDSAPRYVSASMAPTVGQVTPFTACDGNTYYLSASDAAAVNTAAASEATIQLQMAPQGATPQESAALCLVQASP